MDDLISISLFSCSKQIFPQYMKDAGYETHMVGKWHLGTYDYSYLPNNRGFDTYLGYLEAQEMYWTHQVLNNRFGLEFDRTD